MRIFTDALIKISALNDRIAHEHWELTGSYKYFDEPAAVQTAREALLVFGAASEHIKKLDHPLLTAMATAMYNGPDPKDFPDVAWRNLGEESQNQFRMAALMALKTALNYDGPLLMGMPV